MGDAAQQNQKSQLEFMLNMKKQDQVNRKNNMDELKIFFDTAGKGIQVALDNNEVDKANKMLDEALKNNPNLANSFNSLGITIDSFRKEGKDTAITVRMPMTQNMADQTGSTTPLGTPTNATYIQKPNGDIVYKRIEPLIESDEELIQSLMKRGFTYETAKNEVDSYKKSLNGNANLGNNANNLDADFKSYLDNKERQYGKKFDQAQINVLRQEYYK